MWSDKIDASSIYTFNIIIGSSCNWKCPSCIQTDNNTFSKNIDIELFCSNLEQYIHEKNLIDKISRFVLWGGEPLLYLPAVEKLLANFARYATYKPTRVVSNGSLLTSDNYHVFNKHRTHFNLSYHDGQLSDACWEQALKIEKLVVSSLVHHKRLSWDEMYNKWSLLYEEYGRCIPWYVFPIIPTESVPQQYWLTRDDVDQYFENLHHYLERLDNVFYNTAFHGLIYEFSQRGREKVATNPCFNNNTISIDLEGNRYMCHHDCSSKYIVGNIFKTTKQSKTIPIFNDVDYMLITPPEGCQTCSAYNYCLGGCYRDMNKSVTCYYKHKVVELLNKIKTDFSNYFEKRYLDLIL